MADFAIVVDSAGMRAAWAAGCLEALRDLLGEARVAVGSSSGAHTLASFYAGHHSRDFWIDILTSRDVFNGWHLARWRYPANTRYVVDKHLPLIDFKALAVSKTAIYIGLFNVGTGKTEYHPLREDNARWVLMGTISYPFFAPFVHHNGDLYADGGTAEASPLRFVIEQLGIKKVIVFGAYPIGKHFREYDRLTTLGAFPFWWAHRARRALRGREAAYQATLAMALNPPPGVQVLRLAPKVMSPVTTFSRDAVAVRQLWQEGEMTGREQHEAVAEFLKK